MFFFCVFAKSLAIIKWLNRTSSHIPFQKSTNKLTRRMMMRGFSLGIFLVFVLLLLTLTEQSLQLSLHKKKNPTHEAIRQVGPNSGPYVALVTEFGLPDSNSDLFEQSYSFFLYGREFKVGKIKDADVVVLNAGGDIANVVLSLQLLFDIFTVRGVIQFGIAGSFTNNTTLFIGDVAVPESFAFSGNWEWRRFESKKGKLKFGDYNQPEKGDNLLGSVNFEKSVLYSGEGSSQKLLWLPSYPTWLQLATQLKDLKLERCAIVGEAEEATCISNETPKLVFGLKGSSADIYYKNAAIGEFLNKRLNISTVDTISAATTLTCLTNGVPSIVFIAISNLVVGEEAADSTSEAVASINALRAASKFIDLVTSTSTSVY